jgi:hypothetical protein
MACEIAGPEPSGLLLWEHPKEIVSRDLPTDMEDLTAKFHAAVATVGARRRREELVNFSKINKDDNTLFNFCEFQIIRLESNKAELVSHYFPFTAVGTSHMIMYFATRVTQWSSA